MEVNKLPDFKVLSMKDMLAKKAEEFKQLEQFTVSIQPTATKLLDDLKKAIIEISRKYLENQNLEVSISSMYLAIRLIRDSLVESLEQEGFIAYILDDLKDNL